MTTKHDLEELRRLQLGTASKVILSNCFRKPINFVTGFDVAFYEGEAVAAAVTMKYDTLQIVEEKFLHERIPFPYISSFLSFREGPIVMNIEKKLKIKSDVLMLDSHGISHPLFCGCASYVGVMINKPVIGAAKSKLCGEYAYKPVKIGEWVPLTYQGRIVGAVLLSKNGCNPLFISVGHMITLESAVKIVKNFIGKFKIPESTRLAHNLANKIKRDLLTRNK